MFNDITNFGEKENESIPHPRPFQTITPRLDKDTEDARSARVSLPSHISIEPAETMDYSNCATSPSKSTIGYVSSIPGTIYYEGMNSVTRPHIENARVVSESELFVDDQPMPQKVRHTPARMSSENSSVPRMNWSPPQPLAGNSNETQSSGPKYVAQPYTSSALQDNIIPAVAIEEITMDGLTDNGRKPGVDKSSFDKVKGYKSLLILTASIILLAISAVVFSIIYVTAIDVGDGSEDEISEEVVKKCFPECYDPFREACECECYTNKDEKFYTCDDRSYLTNQGEIETKYNFTSESDTNIDVGTDIDTDTDTDTDTDIDAIDIDIGNDIDTDTDTSLVFEDNSFNGDWNAYAGDDDINANISHPSLVYDDDSFTPYTGDDDVQIDYDDGISNSIDIPTDNSCAKMCYRKNIHPRWNPKICHPDCYCNTGECPSKASSSKWKRRYFIWKEWRKALNDDRLEDDILDFAEDDDDENDNSVIEFALGESNDNDGNEVTTPNPTNVFEPTA